MADGIHPVSPILGQQVAATKPEGLGIWELVIIVLIVCAVLAILMVKLWPLVGKRQTQAMIDQIEQEDEQEKAREKKREDTHGK